MEAKISLRFSTIFWDLDVCCSKNYCPSHNISLKMQIQKFSTNVKKLKTKDLKPAPLYNNMEELVKKENRKNLEKSFKGKDGRKINKLWLLASTLLIPQRKKKTGITLVRLCISIIIKKVTIPATILCQKTSISLGNICAGNW